MMLPDNADIDFAMLVATREPPHHDPGSVAIIRLSDCPRPQLSMIG